MAIESLIMYKIPLKSDNPSLDMILSKKKPHPIDKKIQETKLTKCSLFLTYVPPKNEPLMPLESWNMYKMPLK